MLIENMIRALLVFVAIAWVLSDAYTMEESYNDLSNEVLDDPEGGCRDGGGGGGGSNCQINMSGVGKQKTSNIAQKAAQEAKDASDSQILAAEDAARHVKQQLADKALAAANAAEAALAGKQQIVEQLESEVHEGELVVQEEGAALQTTQSTAAAAAQAADMAGIQVKTVSEAVKNAQANVANSEVVSNGAQQELSEKQQLVEAAKKRVELLIKQLECAKNDFKKTKKLAEKAACAAQEARQRASRERRRVELRDKLMQRYRRCH
ncbi:GL24119 [Drosophila persimilis]|uniref:GL24119 n=2 Tax=Drosophila persimilis TaxID=7234 RepID=B4G3R4_DROPE|nr:GL24119 [Drosophila persimilis]